MPRLPRTQWTCLFRISSKPTNNHPQYHRYDGLFISGNARQVLFFPHSGPGESGRIYDHNWDGGIRQVLAGTGGYARQPLHPLELPQNHSHPVFVSSCDFISTEKSIALVHQHGIEHRAIFYWSDGHLCDIARLRNSIQGTKFSLEIDTFCWSATSEKLDQTLAGESL